MTQILCVYKEVEILKAAGAASAEPSERQAIVSYDEKPGMQAVGATAPDLAKPGVHAAFARDHEYKRHGTLSLLAGIDLVTGKVHGLVMERHRSREFIEFLKLLNAAHPASTAIKLILDSHSAHISKETKAWLATQPEGRFIFVFTPKCGSWLNLVEGFFSKLARSLLRHMRVIWENYRVTPSVERGQPYKDFPSFAIEGTQQSRQAAVPVFITSATLGGCTTHDAPSFELFGAFFPAWMFCALIGIFGAIAARGLFVAAGLTSVLPFQLFVCSSVGLVVATLTWLTWFGQ